MLAPSKISGSDRLAPACGVGKPLTSFHAAGVPLDRVLCAALSPVPPPKMAVSTAALVEMAGADAAGAGPVVGGPGGAGGGGAEGGGGLGPAWGGGGGGGGGGAPGGGRRWDLSGEGWGPPFFEAWVPRATARGPAAPGSSTEAPAATPRICVF